MPTGRKHGGGRRRGNGKGKKKKKSSQSRESTKTMSWCTHFPFLQSKRAIALIRRSRVMFLMRGLPGSGKTTIVTHLTERFPSAVVCSADQFMRDEDGTYHYDRSKLSDAHDKCRVQAAEACYSGVPVIIDNTNIKRYEFSFYLLVAQVLSYNVIFVEPRTPWAQDPLELSKRTVHGVSSESIFQKLNSMRPIVALYYGWFLDLRDTDYVCRAARRTFALLTAHRSFSQWYGDLVETCPPEFEEGLDLTNGGAQTRMDTETGTRDVPGASSDDQLLVGASFAEADVGTSSKACEMEMRKNLKRTHSHQVDSSGIYKSRANRLHVTTMYGRRDHNEDILQYATSRVVMNSLGSATELCVTAFFFTPRTIGARIQLTVEQCVLWGKQNEFVGESSDELRETLEIPTVDKALAIVLSDEEVEELSDDSGSEQSDEDEDVDTFCPSLSDVPGTTAHITLGFIKGQRASQTGVDLYEVIRLERELRSRSDVTSRSRQQRKQSDQLLLDQFRIDSGVVRHYAGGVWVVYLDKPVRTDGLFTGCYYH